MLIFISYLALFTYLKYKTTQTKEFEIHKYTKTHGLRLLDESLKMTHQTTPHLNLFVLEQE